MPRKNTNSEENVPKVTEADMNEPATITKGQLAGILSKLTNLENKGAVRKLKRVTDHMATLRFHDDLPVVGYSDVRDIKDKNTGRPVAYMDIKVADGEDVTSQTVEYLKFLNTPNAVQVKILRQEAEEIIESEGSFRTENPNPARDPNTGRPLSGLASFQSRETEGEVVSYRYTAVVEVLEGNHKGEEFTVPADALNN